MRASNIDREVLVLLDTPKTAILVGRNIPVPMRDGVTLSANIFRPPLERTYPVIMSVTPYGKDTGHDRITTWLMRLSGVEFGDIKCSSQTSFEAPDPVYWVQHGYVVVQADVRGMHRSEGHAGVLRDQDAEDYYDLIEWAAEQPWSNGRIGLMGVSYLAMSQWRVAALKPPHLRAIVPWEGVTDLYREFAFHGGIPETRFIPTWWKKRIEHGQNPDSSLEEDFLEERELNPLNDAFWESKRPVLEHIDAPALVCANWSDHGLHTRGSIQGFERIASKHKWLFTHGRRKWETFYSQEALACQKRFFDHFLREIDNGQELEPPIRLEVRSGFYQQTVRAETTWPPQSVHPTKLYLNAHSGQLETEYRAAEAQLSYHPTNKKDRAVFVHRFDQPAELIGSMRLTLWMSTSEGDDMDVFVVLRKLDPSGQEVFFCGYNGYEHDGLAKGWLRASLRELDLFQTFPLRPWHTFQSIERVRPDEIVALDIEIWPSATAFEAGSRLQLTIQGHDAAKYPMFGHQHTHNRGVHTIHTGGIYDSCLTIPLSAAGH